MRKKSHICLAGYLADEFQAPDLMRYRKAFCFGSILPDLNPGMVTSPHEFETTFDGIKELICRLTSEWDGSEYKERAFWRGLGVVMHYLADYFTFPHNTSFQGSLKDHCLYERDLKHQLRGYVKTPEARCVFHIQKLEAGRCRDEQELFEDTQESHRRDMEEEHRPLEDCRWIARLCSRVFMSVICLAENQVYQTIPGAFAESA